MISLKQMAEGKTPGIQKATAKHVEGGKTTKLDQKAARELLQQVACLSQPFST